MQRMLIIMLYSSHILKAPTAIVCILYMHITRRLQWLKEKQIGVLLTSVFNWFQSKVLIRNERQMLCVFRSKYY